VSRVAVFGIDGGTLALVEKWKDVLPNLSRMIDGGAYGIMKSTIPPLTCPAWASMFTGKNPGKLGMFDFWKHDSSLCSSNDYHESALWSILNRYGKSAGLLNIPLTYPPHAINGFMVTGLGTPETMRVEYAYPARLMEILKGYRITPKVVLTKHNQEEKCLKDVAKVLESRVQTAKYLLDRYPTDLFICVFFVTDIIQHYFWRFMDESHPKHEDRYQNAIRNVYQQVDSVIGEMLQDINFVVSDHGFGRCD